MIPGGSELAWVRERWSAHSLRQDEGSGGLAIGYTAGSMKGSLYLFLGLLISACGDSEPEPGGQAGQSSVAGSGGSAGTSAGAGGVGTTAGSSAGGTAGAGGSAAGSSAAGSGTAGGGAAGAATAGAGGAGGGGGMGGAGGGSAGSGGGSAGSGNSCVPNPSGTFSVQGDVVHDAKTCLDWMKVTKTDVGYADAEAYCEGSTLGGFDDWRIPNASELASTITLCGKYPPTDGPVDTKVFDIQGDGYWTTTSAGEPNKVCAIGMNNAGGYYVFGTTGPQRVRCVRGTGTVTMVKDCTMAQGCMNW